MKKLFLTVFIMAIVSVLHIPCSGHPTAKNVLQKAYKKCQSIQSGHYEMVKRVKSTSSNDTTLYRSACDFKKLSDDTVFGMIFTLSGEYAYNGSHNNYLYTGKELVNFDDSTGTIQPCNLWANNIFNSKHNIPFYTPLTDKNSHPLYINKLQDEAYTFSLSKTILDGKPCYLVNICCPTSNIETLNIQTTRHEINIWIDKKDYMPLQYAIALDILSMQDTLHQYEEYKLTAFTPNADESKLTMKALPETIILKEYEPYKVPTPLPKGAAAPQWTLPTLSGDSVSLADLKGKVVVLDFFFKSCVPCWEAMTVLQRLYKKYSDKDFVVIGIDPVDAPKKEEMETFLSKRGITYPILFANRELAVAYHIYGYPMLFLLNRDGNIVAIERGFSKELEENLEKHLDALLKQ